MHAPTGAFKQFPCPCACLMPFPAMSLKRKTTHTHTHTHTHKHTRMHQSQCVPLTDNFFQRKAAIRRLEKISLSDITTANNNRLEAFFNHSESTRTKEVKRFIHCSVIRQRAALEVTSDGCCTAAQHCRERRGNEWTTGWFFYISLSFQPRGIITSSANLASLLHRLSTPITQMFWTVISWNNSWCIAVPAAEPTGHCFVQGKCTKTRFLSSPSSWALLWDQRCVWALKPGMRRITVWLCTVLLCIPAVKSVNPENSCKLLGFEHHKMIWQQLSSLLSRSLPR